MGGCSLSLRRLLSLPQVSPGKNKVILRCCVRVGVVSRGRVSGSAARYGSAFEGSPALWLKEASVSRAAARTRSGVGASPGRGSRPCPLLGSSSSQRSAPDHRFPSGVGGMERGGSGVESEREIKGGEKEREKVGERGEGRWDEGIEEGGKG